MQVQPGASLKHAGKRTCGMHLYNLFHFKQRIGVILIINQNVELCSV